MQLKTIILFFAILLFWAEPVAAIQTLVVGNKDEDTISLIDVRTGKTLFKLKTGSSPHEVAVSPDGRTAVVVAYGGIWGGNELFVFDLQKAELTKTIDLGKYTRPHGICWFDDGQTVAVTSEGAGALVLVRIDLGKVVGSIKTGQRASHMVALSPDGLRAFVTNIGSGTISAIDIRLRRRIRNVKSGPGTEGISISPDGAEIWVTNRAGDSVVVFDADTLERLKVLRTGRLPIRVRVSPDGKHVVIANWRDGTISVIDRLAREVIGTHKVSADGKSARPVSLAFHPEDQKLFVAMPSAQRIAVFDTQSWHQINTFVAGEGADGMAISTLDLARFGHLKEEFENLQEDLEGLEEELEKFRKRKRRRKNQK